MPNILARANIAMPLTNAFLEMVHYIEEIYRHNAIKHLYERTSADAEWAIFQAEKDNYKLWRETGWDAVDIERLALGDGRRQRTQRDLRCARLFRTCTKLCGTAFSPPPIKDGGIICPFNRRDYSRVTLIKFPHTPHLRA